MTEQLKTLKDICCTCSVSDCRKQRGGAHLIQTEYLRLEAIKWYKLFQKGKLVAQLEKTNLQGHYGVEEPILHQSKNLCLNFITYFFNLSEEDLK